MAIRYHYAMTGVGSSNSSWNESSPAHTGPDTPQPASYASESDMTATLSNFTLSDGDFDSTNMVAATTVQCPSSASSSPTSADDTPGNAAQKVLATYELLEQILSQVLVPEPVRNTPVEALKTVLLAQRVNKAFHHVIQRSVEIQERLFFRPNSDLAWPIQKIHLNELFRDSALAARGSNVVVIRAVWNSPSGKYFKAYLTEPSDFLRRCEPTPVEESWKKMLLYHAVDNCRVSAALDNERAPKVPTEDYIDLGSESKMDTVWKDVVGKYQENGLYE